MRSLLRRQIRESWNKALEKDYDNQRINSKRSLQAAVWSQLDRVMPKKTRRMFIEPTVVCGSKRRVPDLVICNSRQIIGIIELKYVPRGRPNFDKDIATFHLLLKNRAEVFVSNARYRGTVAEVLRYSMAKNVLFVWAGVHAKCEASYFDSVPSRLKKHFLPLHAETKEGEILRFG